MPCILITYFKYLYFNYLTALQTNTQNNLGFSHNLPAAHAIWLNTQNCAWFRSEISVISTFACCELSGGGVRPPPSNPPPHQGLCSWTPLGDFRPPDPLCHPYLQILATPLTSVDCNPLTHLLEIWICCTTCSYSCAAVGKILSEAARCAVRLR